jgi:hypothetical protein
LHRRNKGIIRQESTYALSPAKLYASAGDLQAGLDPANQDQLLQGSESRAPNIRRRTAWRVPPKRMQEPSHRCTAVRNSHISAGPAQMDSFER